MNVLRPGWWVALAVYRWDDAPGSYFGLIRAVDQTGVRLTVPAPDGEAAGWDVVVPWRAIVGTLVCVNGKLVGRFYQDAVYWARANGYGGSDNWTQPAAPFLDQQLEA